MQSLLPPRPNAASRNGIEIETKFVDGLFLGPFYTLLPFLMEINVVGFVQSGLPWTDKQTIPKTKTSLVEVEV